MFFIDGVAQLDRQFIDLVGKLRQVLVAHVKQAAQGAGFDFIRDVHTIQRNARAAGAGFITSCWREIEGLRAAIQQRARPVGRKDHHRAILAGIGRGIDDFGQRIDLLIALVAQFRGRLVNIAQAYNIGIEFGDLAEKLVSLIDFLADPAIGIAPQILDLVG